MNVRSKVLLSRSGVKQRNAVRIRLRIVANRIATTPGMALSN
jgi:hypothetical protein